MALRAARGIRSTRTTNRYRNRNPHPHKHAQSDAVIDRAASHINPNQQRGPTYPYAPTIGHPHACIAANGYHTPHAQRHRDRHRGAGHCYIARHGDANDHRHNHADAAAPHGDPDRHATYSNAPSTGRSTCDPISPNSYRRAANCYAVPAHRDHGPANRNRYATNAHLDPAHRHIA